MSSTRPFRHLCPEADERDAMTDDEFWERVGENLGFTVVVIAEGEPEQVQIATPCPTCGSDGACAYDSEGRPLIHAVTDDQIEDHD
jgi:hypothetical protein